MDKYIGKRLQGRYEIEELIGVGGMAFVYKAKDTIEERPVAVKILKDEFLTNEEFTRRFKNESKAIAIMSHPNIVKVYDVNFGERQQYIVMEYIDGITLKEYIDQQRISWKEAVHFTVQILRALQHAHDKGIVHRDIKPQNIMLLADGTIKVTDFGIAHFSHNTMRTGLGDRAIGSVHYISPEQARGGLTDEKADLYSVGIMMYEMLTGKLPFEADNAVSVAIMQLQSQAKKPTALNPDIPEGLEEITLKAMQKDPEHRYQSAAEMLKDINDFKQNPGIRFEYKYFVDDTPTRYVDVITSLRAGDNKPTPKEEEEEKPSVPLIPILIGVVAAIAIIAIIVLWQTGVFSKIFLGGAIDDGESITVPQFIGYMYDDDWDKLKPFAGYVELEYQFSDEPEGKVIDQNYPSGKSIKLNDNHKLVLTISKGAETIEVPDTIKVGSTNKSQCERMITGVGLTVKFEELSSETIKEGYVIKTFPAPGEKCSVTKAVIVYISTGPNMQQEEFVPNTVGAPLQDAIDAFTDAGFKVDMEKGIVYVNNSDYAAGIVVEQTPEGDKKAKRDTQVILKVSSGFKDVTASFDLGDLAGYVDIKLTANGKTNVLANQQASTLASPYQVTFSETLANYTIEIVVTQSGTDTVLAHIICDADATTGLAGNYQSQIEPLPDNPNVEDEPSLDDILGGLW